MMLKCTKIKKNSIFPAVLFMMLALSARMMAQVSVTASAGTTGPTAYTNLTAAFTAINSGVHQGAISIAITANTTESATPVPLLASGVGSSSYTSISIMPSGGSFTVSSATAPVTNRGIIELAGADNVTIDGDDPGTPGTQNLSIVSATTTTSGIACIRLSSNSTTGLNGADNNTIKNCILIGSRSSATSNVTNYGIQFSDGTGTSSSGTGAYSSLNTLIQGNTITRCYYGIHAIGNSASYLNTGTKIIKNTIGSATAASYVAFTGIDITYSSTTPGATSALISQNDIRTGHTSGNATMASVQLGAANAGAIINGNNIHDCINPTSSVWGMYGILISSATSNSGITITNNFIRDIAGYPVSSFGNQYGGYGIYVNAAATGIIINHNTIAQLVSTVIGSCIQITDASATVAQFQNNILVNNVNSPYSCLFYATANANISGGAVNYNDYYINASGVFGYNGANRATFAAWKTATTKDANSLNLLPSFVSATDLHITPAQITYLESAGTGTASTGVNTDYDNDSRPGPVGSVNGGAINPDMGADEFDGIIPPTPAMINSASVSPNSQCIAVAHTVTTNITPGATALTSVYLSYAFNGVAQPTVAMTGGNPSATSNWTGTLPAGVPTNAVVTWSVFAADVSYTLNLAGTSYQDNPLSGVTASAAVSPTVICAGSSATLSASIPAAVTAGTGALITSGSGSSGGNSVSPYSHYYGGNRFQYMFTVAELNAMGLSAGNITSLAFDVTTAGITYNGFAINVAPTALTNLSGGFVTAGLTPVYSANTTPTVGINTYNFSAPYYWNGTSNLVFQICWSNNNTGGTAAEVRYDNTSYVSEYFARADNATPATACGGTGATGSNSARPKMIITGNKTAGFTFAWSDGATTVGTTNPLVVTPTISTTYSATLTNGSGCSVTSSPVTLNVTALPSTPIVTNSSQCGVGVPTASVSGGTNYNWYATPTSTTILQSGTSTNYTTSIAATTTLYVTAINGTCESPRSAIVTTVSIPDGVIASTSASNLCVGGANTITLTATQTGTTNPYSFTWDAAPVAGSGMPTTMSGATVAVSPSLVGTYSYSVTATDGICTTISSVTVAVNDLPVINASASPTAVCSGGNVNLNGTTPAIGAGMVTIGTGTLTTTNTQELTSFCNRRINYRMQTVYTAAELSAAGLYAGNITAITYSIIANGSSNTNTNFAVKCGTTTATSFTDFISNAGFTTVVPATSYTHAVGANTITFTTPFNWDGTSNLVIEMTHDGIDDLYNAETYYTTTPLNTVAYGYNTPTTGTPSSSRFNITFSGQAIAQGAGGLTWQWNPGAINSNTATVNPINTGTTAATQVYTVTGTSPATGCSNTATASVVVNPVPATPLTADATQCGAGVPTASVSGGTSYIWYATPTSTTVLQSGTSSTYTSSINTTTTWYVSSTNGVCLSPRAALTQTVVTAPALSVTTPTGVVCANSIETLSITSTVGDYDSYVWSPNTNLFTDAAATTPYTGGSASVLYFSSSASSTYSYAIDANNTGNGCVNSTSVTINTDQPVIVASATPTLLCAGSTVSLTANASIIAPGTAAIGTGTSTTSGSNVSGGSYISPYSHYFGGYKSQYIMRASELQAAGLTAGNITALSLNIVSTGTTYTNFAISMAATTQSVATTTFDGTVSQVYGPSNVTPVVGMNMYTFTTPFNWNGTSNIVIQICWSNNNTGGGGAAEVVYSATSYASTSYYRVDSQTSSAVCGQTSATGTINNRPNIVLSGQKITTGAGSLTWQWNPGAINSNTTTVIAVNTGSTATTETYTVTALDPATTCTNSATVNFTVNPIPAVTASASSSAVCAGTSATLTAGGATNYTWTAGGNTATQVVTPSALSVYTVTGATAGCSNTATVSVDVTPNPTVTAVASQTLLCDDGSTGSSILTASSNASSYLWSDGAMTMTTSVTPTTTTVYTVTVTEMGCSADAVVTVNVSNCTGVKEASMGNGISLYPNPTNGIVNISISSELSGTTSVEIYDAIGKLVISEKLNKDITTINTTKLEDGMYMFKIINDNKAIKTGRLIKQ